MKGKKNQKAQEPVITEEDKLNDPFIRAIAKKVRNINKKTLDIEVLEKREDLKPEQLEKINSKQTLLDEKKRFEDFVKFYKSTLTEAANEKEAKQVSPIVGKLSHSLILAHYLSSGSEVKDLNLTGQEKKALSNLSSVGKQQATLNDLGNQLSGYFTQYLDNQKLVTKVEELFSNQNTGALRVNLYQRPETPQVASVAPVAPVAPVVQQTKKEVQNTPKKVTAVVQKIEVVEHVVEPVVVPQTEQAVPATEQKTSAPETAAVTEQAVKTEETPAAETPAGEQTQPKQEGVQKERPNKPYNKRPYRPREGEQGYKGEGYQQRRGGYKPRYNERREKNEDESSGEDEQNLKTSFNNKEMRDLQNDGFVIVQKKQKPKDLRESAAFYKKQHGYKDKKIHDHHNHS